jgi:serine/threonine protein kinase
MPPEQLRDRKFTKALDIYSLEITFFIIFKRSYPDKFLLNNVAHCSRQSYLLIINCRQQRDRHSSDP